MTEEKTERYEMEKTFDPSKIEPEVSREWIESGAFHATPDERERPYVIMMPLPNVTGALHMGHAMDNVMQDLLIRWHRMMGDNTLWMPGTDHAGIATQAVVEKRLKELEGLTRHDVGRDGLIERIWKWKDQFQSRIVRQQQRMGCSADWQRQRFTMDAVCSRAVRHTFMRMFEDGLIFRGKRLVNWDPFLRTSISDDEVYHETVQGHFWHLRYPVIDPQEGDPQYVVVATTRPETMLGDTAVAVHPDPEGALAAEQEKLELQLSKASKKERPALEKELQALKQRREEMTGSLVHLRDMAADGRKVMHPLMDRPIPLILDQWAKPHMGSGCVKITPAHDPNDYDVWTRHKEEIDIINILNPDGTLNTNAGPYSGLDRFEARDKVVADLKEKGLLGEVEDRQIEIGHSDRSKSPIEPYLSDQWFVHMADVDGGVVMGRNTPREHTRPGLVQAAMDMVEEGRVRFHPERFKKTYMDWLSEKRDWPVSRQLWWGHRIPVWSRATTFEEVPEQIHTLKEALRDLWPQKAAIRLVRKDPPLSLLVVDDFELPKDTRGEWLLDVCLLEDSPGAHILAELGYERDPDVLDTWFSSALWPHSTLGWPDPKTADVEGTASLGPQEQGPDCLSYYYPGSCLVTARDIITLWVARMVMTGMYNLGDIPFSDVFIHANILDGKGERMSKSKGNGIDPVDIIESYGTDAMRYVLCDMQTGNQDIRLPVTAICPGCGEKQDLAKLKHGRNIFTYVCSDCGAEFDVLGTMPDLPAAKLISERFVDGSKFCNKLWNTARFAFGNLDNVQHRELSIDDLELEDRWILASMNRAIKAVNRGLEQYNPSAALGAARDFMWSELCDWYLELIKPRLEKNDSSAQTAKQVLAHALDQTLRLLHPFVPFITEHLYQKLCQVAPHRGLPGLANEKEPHSLLMTSAWPRPAEKLEDPDLLETFADLQSVTSGVREVRSSRGVSPAKSVKVTVRPPADRAEEIRAQAHVIEHMANVSELNIDPEAHQPMGSASLVADQLQIFVHDVVDPAEERTRLQKELKRVDKEISICDKKLGNPKFVDKAPVHVVEEQKTRKKRYEAEKEAIVRSLQELSE